MDPSLDVEGLGVFLEKGTPPALPAGANLTPRRFPIEAKGRANSSTG